MRESYVPPVTGAREPKAEWVAVWRFRMVGFVLLAAAAVLTVWLVNKVLYAAEQDPTPVPSPSALAQWAAVASGTSSTTDVPPLSL